MAKQQKTKKPSKVLKKLNSAVKIVKKTVVESVKSSSKSKLLKTKKKNKVAPEPKKPAKVSLTNDGKKSSVKKEMISKKDAGAKDTLHKKNQPQKTAVVPAKEVKKTALSTTSSSKMEEKSSVASAKKTDPKVDAKKDAKAKKGKKEEVELDDDFIADDVMGGDEIGEYAEELKAVEEADQEVSDEDVAWSSDQDRHSDGEIILTDAEGRRYCRARDCDQIAVVDGYCRYHYLLFWKKIQVRKKILMDGKLERYVEELTSRYPDKFLEVIRRDLRSEKDFLSSIQEMEIDESGSDNDFEEDAQSFIEEVRGMGGGDSPTVDDEEF